MKKDWVLTIGIDKFYLTKEEKDFYLESIAKGSKYVVIDTNKILGTSFQSLVSQQELSDGAYLAKGMEQCSFGKWHKGTCMCGIDYEIVDGKAIPRKLTSSNMSLIES